MSLGHLDKLVVLLVGSAAGKEAAKVALSRLGPNASQTATGAYGECGYHGIHAEWVGSARVVAPAGVFQRSEAAME